MKPGLNKNFGHDNISVKSLSLAEISKQEKRKSNLIRVFGVVFGIVVGAAILFFSGNVINSLSFSIVFIALFFLFAMVQSSMKKSARLKKMEEAFPDFLQLVSSNLRAGITVDKALLLSARKEFAPLDEEILRAGKDITTGKSLEFALSNMAERINSEVITKTIMLINSGLESGGNISTLLEQTSSGIRGREFVRKKAASNVLMYVIFVFIAVAIGAPALFALSTILSQAMMGMMTSTPELDSTIANLNIPFSFSSVGISLNFIIYFSIVFILVIDVLAVLVIGLVSKGNERAGLKYLIPIIIVSLLTFLGIRFFLADFVSGLF